jgi:asparagine synthase (glutamine-hydrolysing)
MFTDCGNYSIIFNGEIYNHSELRGRLKNSINFKGHSDTESILYYLREFGIDGVKDFNGIFAFAFLDLVKQKLYLTRDHFGIKPLYYYSTKDKLIYGSELKVILNNKAYQKCLNVTALDTFLTFRYNPSPQTLFKGINKLAPAHYLEYNIKGGAKLVRYWSSKPTVNSKIKEGEAIEEYKSLLVNSVKRQLLSDVPVGLLLSGGVDSAVLGYLMSRNVESPINTFTVGFPGVGDYNELPEAREVANLLNSKHYNITIEQKEYMDFFYKSFYFTEEPIAEPTIPALYYVSKLASEHVKVVLSGQGADEPMAGYKRYLGEYFFSKYGRWMPYLPVEFLTKLFPANGTLARGLYASKFAKELDRFIGIYTLFTPELKRNLYQEGALGIGNKDQSYLFESNYQQGEKLPDSLSRLLYLDTRTMLPDNLLLFNDKLTMANSIENRVPYLDIDLVNFVESLPSNFKLKGYKGKYLHLKAAEEWLPASIINRKKKGFVTPVSQWFKSGFSEVLTDLIDSKDSLSKQYLNVGFIKSMLCQHKNKQRDFHRQLFIILSLELWYKFFFNKFLILCVSVFSV